MYEMCENIKLTYLFSVCTDYILAKRVLTEAREDRGGSARNELRELK